MTNPRYYATLDRNGTEDEIVIHTPEGRPMLSVAFWDDEGPDEDGNPDPLKASADQIKADAALIVQALNARLRRREIAVALFWGIGTIAAFSGLLALVG